VPLRDYHGAGSAQFCLLSAAKHTNAIVVKPQSPAQAFLDNSPWRHCSVVALILSASPCNAHPFSLPTKSLNRPPIHSERRTEKVQLRVSRSDKAKLQAAASPRIDPWAASVVQSALSKEEEMLTERIFALDAKKWVEFQRALDALRPFPD
jgi:uncharacterized protein (DUF1778 family)